jgi:hypothetical protein
VLHHASSHHRAAKGAAGITVAAAKELVVFRWLRGAASPGHFGAAAVAGYRPKSTPETEPVSQS